MGGGGGGQGGDFGDEHELTELKLMVEVSRELTNSGASFITPVR